MKARKVGFAFVALTLLIPSPSARAATPRTLVAKVERVGDSDTLVGLAENGTKLRLRLLGIDAPEVAHRTIETRPSERFE